MLLVEAPPPRKRKKFRLILIVVAATLLILAVIGGCFVTWWTKAVTPRLESTAERRWAEMGRSMAKFEKELRPIKENDSLKALTRDLEPFGFKTLYKTQPYQSGIGPTDPQAYEATRSVCELLDLTSIADRVAEAERVSNYLTAHARDLDRLYQGILQRETPVWSCNLREFIGRRSANWVAIRQVSQLICLDALHRLELGDEKGASDAIKAGWKMTGNLGEQPYVDSFMIRSGIENLFTAAIARLPEDPEALGQLAADIDTNRERWRKAVQAQAWETTHLFDYVASQYNTSLIQKAQNAVTRLFTHHDGALFLARVADDVRTSQQVNALAISTLGVNMMQGGDSRSSADPATDWFSKMWAGTLSASWIRTNAFLLRREQAEIIRGTRTRVQAGESGDLGDRDSLVAPGAKWHVVADTKSNSASFQLRPLPAWTTENKTVDQSLFLIPLDGSKSWTFRKRQPESPVGRLVSK